MISFQPLPADYIRPYRWLSSFILGFVLLHQGFPAITLAALPRTIQSEEPVQGALDVGDIDPASAGVNVRETWALEGHADQWIELVGVGDPLLTPTVLELFDPAGQLLVEERWYLPPNAQFAVVGLGSKLPSDGSYQIVLTGLRAMVQPHPAPYALVATAKSLASGAGASAWSGPLAHDRILEALETFGLEPPSASEIIDEERLAVSDSLPIPEVSLPSTDDVDVQTVEATEGVTDATAEPIVEAPVPADMPSASETINNTETTMAGLWHNDDLGSVEVTQTFRDVIGRYGSNGHFEGTLDAGTLVAFWWDQSGVAVYEEADPTHRGLCELHLANDGETLTGQWRYEGDVDWVGTWTFRREHSLDTAVAGTWIGGPWTQLVITQREHQIHGADPQMGLLQGALKGQHVRGIWWSAESPDDTYLDTERTQRGSFSFAVDRDAQHMTAEWRIEGVADWVGSTELSRLATPEETDETVVSDAETPLPVAP